MWYLHEINNVQDLHTALQMKDGDEINFHKLNVALLDKVENWDRFMTTKNKGVIRTEEDFLDLIEGLNSYARPFSSTYIGQSDPGQQRLFYEQNTQYLDNLVRKEIESGKLTFDDQGRSKGVIPEVTCDDIKTRSTSYIMYAYEHFIEEMCNNLRYAKAEMFMDCVDRAQTKNLSR